jgi:uncharacterized protein DUF4136
MKIVRLINFLIVSSIILAACSSPVYVQKDESANLAKYKTYMWVETRSEQNDNVSKTAFADMSIHNAVNAQLSREGWREVSDNPDVLVSHDILVQHSTQTQSSPVYTQPLVRYYYNPWARRWGSIYYPSQFMGYDTYETPVREATITVTFVDARTDKPIWQGWTTEELNGRKITDSEISKAVKNIFKKFDKELR